MGMLDLQKLDQQQLLIVLPQMAQSLLFKRLARQWGVLEQAEADYILVQLKVMTVL
jgi:hypothetical protein